MKTIDVLLEYVPGGTLKSILQKYENLEIPIIKKYGKQLLSGLMYLHGNKIIHRDLKPANVLINQDGILKLTDFGSCREFGDLEVSISRSLKGSPYWMAPEVVKMEGHSFSADIWSFGCMLIEMISGRPPWSNISNDSKQVMELISKEDPWDQIPSTECELTEIIKLCLNKRPDLRPSAEDLLNLPFFQSCYK
jgi:serine/threonine protein kinase